LVSNSPESVGNFDHRHLIFRALNLGVREIQNGSLDVVLVGFVDEDVRSSHDNPSLLPSRTTMLQHVQVAFSGYHRTRRDLLQVGNKILNVFDFADDFLIDLFLLLLLPFV
jgi:hypothetical protein